MGLGSAALVTLLQARQAAARARAERDKGVDPLAGRGRGQSSAPAIGATFREAATIHIALHSSQFSNGKHAAQWPSTMERYVYPVVGDKLAHEVTRDDLVKVLKPIWLVKHETARRVRARIETILDGAKVREGWPDYHNPAALRGNLVHLLPADRKVRAVRHHPALPYEQASEFMPRLRASSGTGARALEWTILTAARTNMTLGATWSEIDFQNRIWTVPESRMKNQKELRVPLPDAAMNVLDDMLALRDPQSDYIFPGQSPGRHLSDGAMIMVLRRLARHDITVHGFRSTFRDWAGEETDVASDVGEAALAHALPGGKTRAAYQRGNLLGKRVALMAAWATFLSR